MDHGEQSGKRTRTSQTAFTFKLNRLWNKYGELIYRSVDEPTNEAFKCMANVCVCLWALHEIIELVLELCVGKAMQNVRSEVCVYALAHTHTANRLSCARVSPRLYIHTIYVDQNRVHTYFTMLFVVDLRLKNRQTQITIYGSWSGCTQRSMHT